MLSNYKNMETYKAIKMISHGQWLDKLIILIGYEQLHLKNSRRKGDKFGKGIRQIALKIFKSNSKKLTW